MSKILKKDYVPEKNDWQIILRSAHMCWLYQVNYKSTAWFVITSDTVTSLHKLLLFVWLLFDISCMLYEKDCLLYFGTIKLHVIFSLISVYPVLTNLWFY